MVYRTLDRFDIDGNSVLLVDDNGTLRLIDVPESAEKSAPVWHRMRDGSWRRIEDMSDDTINLMWQPIAAWHKRMRRLRTPEDTANVIARTVVAALPEASAEGSPTGCAVCCVCGAPVNVCDDASGWDGVFHDLPTRILPHPDAP